MAESEKPKVVHIRGEPVTDIRVPDPDVIAKLEYLLEQAKSGEITGICGVMHYYDSTTGRFYKGIVSYAVVGRLETVKLSILEDLGA